MFAYNLLHASTEVRLQILTIIEPAGAHEGLDLLVCVPLLAVYLITADMEVLVRKMFGHFANEFVEELIGSLLSGVHRRIKDAPLAFDLIRSRAARQFRIANEPRCAVSRHVEL